MYPWKFPRAEVLQTIYEAVKPMAEKTFLTTRSSSIAEQIKDYIIVRLPNGIRDNGDTYQTAKVHLYLFARDRAGEIENAFRLEEMQNAVCGLFPFIHKRFTADRPQIIGGNADSGFHYLIIQISITINKKTINP